MAVLTALKLVLNTGYRFVYPFLPIVARGLGVDAAAMGVLLSTRSALGLITPFAVGRVGIGKSRRLLVMGLVFFGVGSVVTPVFGVLVGAFVGFALIGLGKPVFDIGSQTYVSARVPYARRGRALGTLELSWAGGLLLGAPAAGWLIDRWGWANPFWVLGVLALIAAGVVIFWLEESDGSSTVVAAHLSSIRSAMPFFAAVALTGFTLELIFVVLGAWLEDAFALTLAGLAGVGSVLGVAELFGEGLMVSVIDRLGKRRSFMSALGASTVVLVGLGFTHGRLVAGLGTLFVVVLLLEFSVISAIPLASELYPRNRPRAFAWTLVAAGVGRVVADLIGSPLYGAGGMRAVAFTAAATALVGATVVVTRVEEFGALSGGR